MSQAVLRSTINKLRSLSDLEMITLRCTIDRKQKRHYDDLIPELLHALAEQVAANKQLKKKRRKQ